MTQELTVYDGEEMELRRLSCRVDSRRAKQEREQAEARALRAERKLRQERRAHREEMKGMAAFFGVTALVVAACVCVAAAPVWTAVFPFAGALAVMRKAGWL